MQRMQQACSAGPSALPCTRLERGRVDDQEREARLAHRPLERLEQGGPVRSCAAWGGAVDGGRWRRQRRLRAAGGAAHAAPPSCRAHPPIPCIRPPFQAGIGALHITHSTSHIPSSPIDQRQAGPKRQQHPRASTAAPTLHLCLVSVAHARLLGGPPLAPRGAATAAARAALLIVRPLLRAARLAGAGVGC